MRRGKLAKPAARLDRQTVRKHFLLERYAPTLRRYLGEADAALVLSVARSMLDDRRGELDGDTVHDIVLDVLNFALVGLEEVKEKVLSRGRSDLFRRLSNSALDAAYGLNVDAAAPIDLPCAGGRAGARPRERREQRHVARSTSSADGPSDSEPPSRSAATRTVVA